MNALDFLGKKKGTASSSLYRVLEWVVIISLIYTAYYEATDKLNQAKKARDQQVTSVEIQLKDNIEQITKKQGDLRDRVFRLESALMQQPPAQCKK